jgi:hypothetical protein
MGTSLDIWLPIPISMACRNRVDKKGIANTIAAVERHDRTSQIAIRDIQGSRWKKTGLRCQEQIPLLALFYLESTDESVLVLPEPFLHF